MSSISGHYHSKINNDDANDANDANDVDDTDNTDTTWRDSKPHSINTNDTCTIPTAANTGWYPTHPKPKSKYNRHIEIINVSKYDKANEIIMPRSHIPSTSVPISTRKISYTQPKTSSYDEAPISYYDATTVFPHNYSPVPSSLKDTSCESVPYNHAPHHYTPLANQAYQIHRKHRYSSHNPYNPYNQPKATFKNGCGKRTNSCVCFSILGYYVMIFITSWIIWNYMYFPFNNSSHILMDPLDTVIFNKYNKYYTKIYFNNANNGPIQIYSIHNKKSYQTNFTQEYNITYSNYDLSEYEPKCSVDINTKCNINLDEKKIIILKSPDEHSQNESYKIYYKLVKDKNIVNMLYSLLWIGLILPIMTFVFIPVVMFIRETYCAKLPLTQTDFDEATPLTDNDTNKNKAASYDAIPTQIPFQDSTKMDKTVGSPESVDSNASTPRTSILCTIFGESVTSSRILKSNSIESGLCNKCTQPNNSYHNLPSQSLLSYETISNVKPFTVNDFDKA